MVVEIRIIASILAIVFVAYLLITYKIFGFIGSISNSYYQYRKRYKLGIVFTLFMLFISVCLIAIVYYLKSNDAIWFFGAATGAAFTGLASQYKEKLTMGVHFAGASGLITFTALGIGFIFGAWWVVLSILAIMIAFILLEFGGRRTEALILYDVYWFEVVCFIVLISGLIIQ